MNRETQKFPRYFPCLWDNLQDNDPGHKIEPAASRAMRPRLTYEAVARDIQMLLNSPAPFHDEDLEDLPDVARSVFNYGITNYAGARTSSLTQADIEDSIRRALTRYEPRIIAESLEVRAIDGRNESRRINLQAFEISGRIWAVPFPEELYLYTELDLETGNFRLSN